MLTIIKIVDHKPGSNESTSTTANLEKIKVLDFPSPIREIISDVEKNGRNFDWGILQNDLGHVGRVGTKNSIHYGNYYTPIYNWLSRASAKNHLELSYEPTHKAVYSIQSKSLVGIGIFLKNDIHQIYVVDVNCAVQIGPIIDLNL